MKQRIWKYPLELGDDQIIAMPDGAQILTVQMQGSKLCLWALVDPEPELPQRMRSIEIIGTGNPFVEAPRVYIATVQVPPFVWHVFERTA